MLFLALAEYESFELASKDKEWRMKFIFVSIAVCATFMASTAFAGISDLELSQKLVGVWNSEEKIPGYTFYSESSFRDDGTVALIFERCREDYGCKSASFETT